MNEPGREPANTTATIDPDGDLPADRLTVVAGLILPAALTLAGLWVCWYATTLVFYTPLGPGPGFFPMWLGGLLTVFSAWILATEWRSTRNLPRLLPELNAGVRMAITLAMIGFFALLIESLGFAITMFVILLVLLPTYGTRMVPTGLTVAVCGSFGVGFAFTRLLNVYLPPAPYALLRFMGL